MNVCDILRAPPRPGCAGRAGFAGAFGACWAFRCLREPSCGSFFGNPWTGPPAAKVNPTAVEIRSADRFIEIPPLEPDCQKGLRTRCDSAPGAMIYRLRGGTSRQ